MTDGDQSKGVRFVLFSSLVEAMGAIKEMNGHMVGSKPLHVALAQSKEERKAHLITGRLRNRKKMSILPDCKHWETIKTSLQQGKILFVVNQDDKIDDESLRKEFLSFGTIARMKVISVTSWCQRKAVGFARYTSPELATEAMTEMNIHCGKWLHLVLAKTRREMELSREALTKEM